MKLFSILLGQGDFFLFLFLLNTKTNKKNCSEKFKVGCLSLAWHSLM